MNEAEKYKILSASMRLIIHSPEGDSIAEVLQTGRLFLSIPRRENYTKDHNSFTRDQALALAHWIIDKYEDKPLSDGDQNVPDLTPHGGTEQFQTT